MKDKFLSIIKKKWLKSAILTVVLFAIIIGAYAGIIYGMSKTNISDIDFTKDKIYSISQATKDRLKNLEEDITISVYNMSEYINDFAYKYANINDHIKIEEVDNLISKAPWKANYGVTDTSSFILIQAENKEKILYDSDLYTIDYTTYEQIDTTECNIRCYYKCKTKNMLFRRTQCIYQRLLSIYRQFSSIRGK